VSTADVVQRVVNRFSHLDILINNLGVYEPKSFEAISDQDWHAIIETNFMSGVRLSRHYLPEMKAMNWGRIIFISSESAINIPVEMIHYGVTKTMQLALARGLAEMTTGAAVTVNSVLAGPTRSEGVETFLNQIAQSRDIERSTAEKECFATVRPSSLLKRFASTDEVASLVTFIASPLSSAINGGGPACGRRSCPLDHLKKTGSDSLAGRSTPGHAGDFCLRIAMNSRIQDGLSGQARADTIIPSTTASESTNSAPAAFISGARAG